MADTMQNPRGNPLPDEEVVFRIVKKAGWLEEDCSCNETAYILENEDFLSFARGEQPPDCTEINEEHDLSTSHGCDGITAAKIRDVFETHEFDGDIYEDVFRATHACLDLPDPVEDTTKARDIGYDLAAAVQCTNRTKCKNGNEMETDRACPEENDPNA